MYLSSWRLGDHPEKLLALSAGPGSVAVICNALDAEPESVRVEGVLFEMAALRQLGYQAVEVDLRKAGAAQELTNCDVVWVRGGNVFALRDAMARSGADAILMDLVRADKVVYAGYSAGCCVLAPSLRGLEEVDDPGVVDTPIWDGLGLLDHVILPHYRSDHSESASIELVAKLYQHRHVPHLTLHDGEVIVIGLDALPGLWRY